jgi:LysR family transcriptional regulator of gallate degradation
MQPELLNIRHLQALIYAAKSGSLHDAAERVFLSQPAVSQGIHKLEQQLGCSLLERSKRGTMSVPESENFIARVERALRWIDRISLLLDKKRPDIKYTRLLSAAQLRIFSRVVDTENFNRAALSLGLTQPTITRTINDIETICEQHFFHRSPFGVQPNHTAKNIARVCDIYFSELKQAITSLQEAQGKHEGELVVGSLPLARTDLVPSAVIRLLNEYPNCKVSIQDGPYDSQLHELHHGRIDIIVGALRPKVSSNELAQYKLFDELLDVVVRQGHPLAELNKIDIHKLAKLQWIAPREGTPARQVFKQLFTDAGVSIPVNPVECSSLVAIRKLLMSSDRATLLSQRQVAVDVDNGSLAILPIILPGTGRDIGYTTRKEWEPTQLQRRFLELLIEEAASD